MLHQVPKPDISSDFTIEDIRKIRSWHYEILKDATPEEWRSFYNSGSQEYEKLCRELGIKTHGTQP